MKKIISIALWSLSCLATTPPDETIAARLQREYQSNPQDMPAIQKVFIKEEHKRQQQEQAQEFPPELVDSLIEHSPTLIKKYVQYLQYSRNTGKVEPKTLFMHGPSGVGKTETAIALAIKAKMAYTIIHGAQLGDKYQNSAKNQLKELIYPIIERDRPHVIIIDECMRLVENYNDEKGTHEDNNTATAFWDLLDQCTKAKNILVIATANSIERCPEMVRTRFGSNTFVEFKMPDKAARKRILKVQMPKEYICSEALLDTLAKETDGVSPRDIRAIIKFATLNVACEHKGRSHFEFEDFKNEIERCKKDKKGFYAELQEICQNGKAEFKSAPFAYIAKAISTASSLCIIKESADKIISFFTSNAKNVEAIQETTQKVVSKVAPKIAEKVAEISPQIVQLVTEKFGKHASTVLRLLAR